eukprot:scaffold83085_cov24-Tisochrysis_lutea.AAC.2
MSAGSEKPSAGLRAMKDAHALARAARRIARCSALEILTSFKAPSWLASPASPPSVAVVPCSAPLSPSFAPSEPAAARAAPSPAPREVSSALMSSWTASMASHCQGVSLLVRMERALFLLANP